MSMFKRWLEGTLWVKAGVKKVKAIGCGTAMAMLVFASSCILHMLS